MPLPLPFKPGATIEIQADGEAYPGAELPVYVKLIASEDLQPKEVRLELLGRETYYVKQHTSSGKTSQTRIVKKEADFSKTTVSLADHPNFISGMDYNWRTNIIIPADASPTSRGKLVNIEWKLKVVVDVSMRFDQSAGKDIRVLRQPSASSQIRAAAQQKVYDDCTISLEIPDSSSGGEILMGYFGIDAKKAFQCRGLRVELSRIEKAGARNTTEKVSSADIPSTGGLNQYEPQKLDFSLSVPESIPPSSSSPHSSLTWVVKGIIDRKMRTDFNVEKVISVFSPVINR